MTGRVAVVTGGTGALGQAITGALLEAGATVAIPYAVAEERAALRERQQCRRAHGDARPPVIPSRYGAIGASPSVCAAATIAG